MSDEACSCRAYERAGGCGYSRPPTCCRRPGAVSWRASKPPPKTWGHGLNLKWQKMPNRMYPTIPTPLPPTDAWKGHLSASEHCCDRHFKVVMEKILQPPLQTEHKLQPTCRRRRQRSCREPRRQRNDKFREKPMQPRYPGCIPTVPVDVQGCSGANGRTDGRGSQERAGSRFPQRIVRQRPSPLGTECFSRFHPSSSKR
jgi:hypothetical protein